MTCPAEEPRNSSSGTSTTARTAAISTSLDEIFAADYLHHDPANPDPRPVVGPQGVQDHLTSLMGAFPDLKFEVDD